MSGDTQMTDVDKWMEQRYNAAMREASGKDAAMAVVPDSSQKNVAEIVSRSESGKAALAVSLTCLVYKIFHPEQDIRKHQASIENGFSGRTFDTNHIIVMTSLVWLKADGLHVRLSKKARILSTTKAQ